VAGRLRFSWSSRGPVAESESPLAAYVIAEFTVGDSTWVETYASLATQATLEHGGEYLARGVVPETLEGSFDPDERLAILRFPDVDAARAWYSSETYSKALAATGGALRRRLFIVET